MTSNETFEKQSGEIFCDNVDRMAFVSNEKNMLDDAAPSQDYVPTFNSRSTQLQDRMRKQNRNLWLTILCFFPTCGYCCGLCAS